MTKKRSRILLYSVLVCAVIVAWMVYRSRETYKVARRTNSTRRLITQERMNLPRHVSATKVSRSLLGTANLPKIFKSYSQPHVMVMQPGPRILLTQYMHPYEPQKGGSCTGHSMGQLLRYLQWRTRCSTRAQCVGIDQWRRPCPYFLWYLGRCGRAVEHCPDKSMANTGANGSQIALAIFKYGFLYEGQWQVDGQDISASATPWVYRPTAAHFEMARKNIFLGKRARVYGVQSASIYNVLLAGYPVIIQILVGDGLVEETLQLNGSAVQAIVPIKDGFVRTIESPGHAMIAIGAQVVNGMPYFQLNNSWGADNAQGWFISLKDFERRYGNAFTIANTPLP